jgi:ribosome-binding factor A
MPVEHGTRARRVAEAIREELASLLANEVKDPGARGVVVTRAHMSNDLRMARVHVRLLERGDEPGPRLALLEALNRASGMLRRELTQRLGLRFAPELRFSYDEGLDQTARVEALLAEIEAERRTRSGNR